MAKSIGIDLGTTNSVGAIKKVHTEVLKNAEGDLITPSCVTINMKSSSNPEYVIGKHALDWIKQDPENTIVAVKRLMGRNYQDKEIRDIIKSQKLRYQIKRHSRGSENSLAVILGGKEHTPEEISAKILEKMRADAEITLGDTVEFAVITVPAYFNDKQKHATRTSAVLAGLKVRRLLPEPTAAAISFGVDTVKGDDAKTVLIFDFGGGTFDLSVLTISGGQFIEHGKGGDMWLGGQDIDHLIADWVLEETAKKYQLENIEELIEKQDEGRKNRFLAELKTRAEQAKITLSTKDKAYIEMPGILMDSDGDSIDVEVELNQERFNAIIAPTVEATVQITLKMLKNTDFTPDLIDNVLMVGGSSQIPSLVAALRQEFGEEKVLVHERPMLAIAEGAAILSHRLSDTYECPGCGEDVSQSDRACGNCGFDLETYTIAHGVLDIVHAAAHDYYIRLENDERYLFIEKNTPLPVEKSEVFRLVHPEQKLIHMKFYNMVNEKEESIGDLWLGLDTAEQPDRKDKKETFNVEIALKIDENNLIEVSAAMKEQPQIKLSKKLSRGKADEKLYLSLEQTINEANRNKYTYYVMIDLLHRALSVIKDINRIVAPETDEVDEIIYKKAKLKLDKARKMSENGRSSRTVINYANNVLWNFGTAIPPGIQKEIRKKIKRLEDMDEKGTYEENNKAIKDLNNILSEKLGAVNQLMEIQKAGEFCMRTKPSKAPRFFKYIKDILEALAKKDEQKAHSLLDEIMPDAYSVVDKEEAKPGVIYKDIAR